MPRATETAYSQPEQAAFRSKAGIVGRFRRSCRMAAVDGMATSGVVVASTIGVDVLVVDARLADRLQGRLVRHAGRLFVLGGPAPLADARHLVHVLCRDLGKRRHQFGVASPRAAAGSRPRRESPRVRCRKTRCGAAAAVSVRAHAASLATAGGIQSRIAASKASISMIGVVSESVSPSRWKNPNRDTTAIPSVHQTVSFRNSMPNHRYKVRGRCKVLDSLYQTNAQT